MQPIYAEETLLGTEPTTITIELGDMNAAETIKINLIDLKVDGKLFPDLKDHIDIEHSELKIEGLDISKLGIQEVMVHMTIKSSSITKNNLLFNNIITEKINIYVVDTTAPVITLKYPKIRLDFEEELNPDEWVESIVDNSNTDVISIDADISQLDIKTPGDYEVVYSAQDIHGNIGYATLHVTVKKKKVAPKTYTTTSSSVTVSSDTIQSMLSMMNAARAENGLSALTLGDEKAQAAINVRACEAASYVSHRRPDGRHYKTAFDDYGVSYSHPYEILTYSGSTTTDKFNWWMGSSGHRAIVLRSNGTRVAIGYCGKMWATIVYND